MRIDNLGDVSAGIQELFERVERLESAKPQNNMTQDPGGLFEFLGTIRGRGGRLELLGTELWSDGNASFGGAFRSAGRASLVGGADVVGTLGVTGHVSAGGFGTGGTVTANGGVHGGTGNFSGLTLRGLPAASSPANLDWLAVSGTTVMRVPQSVGGPMGDLVFPFPASMVTDEFGPRASPGGIGSTYHRGMDFGAAGGTPIPSAGAGVVIEVFGGGGFGNGCVVQHSGGKSTLYAHMQSAPYVGVGTSVARRQILGPVGTTGSSTGNHLHFEVHVNGVAVNPRSVITKWP